MKRPSHKPVVQKLGIKAGYRIAVLNSPKGYTSILSKVPANVSLTTRLAGEPFDLVQAFYTDARSLRTALPKLKRSIHPLGKIWVCWRKGNVDDLSRDSIWVLGDKVGLDSVASCAIDEDWSAMKLMLPKAKRIVRK